MLEWLTDTLYFMDRKKLHGSGDLSAEKNAMVSIRNRWANCNRFAIVESNKLDRLIDKSSLSADNKKELQAR